MRNKLLILSIFFSLTGAAQNVGIGETSPASKLSVKGGTSIGAAYSATASPPNGAIIQGRVGIGTVAPVGLLQVENCDWSSSGTNMVIIEDTFFTGGGGPSIRFHGPFSTFDILGSTGLFNGLSGNFSIYNKTNNVVCQTISPYGNTCFGGTTLTAERLTTMTQSDTNLLNGGIGIYTPGGVASLSIGAMGIQSGAVNQNLALNANGTGNICMQYAHTTGNVGIGTSVPAAKLDVAGNIKASNVQLTAGAMPGYLLQSDASGNATWANPAAVSGQNIYNTDGGIAGARTVTLGANNLTFSATTGNFIFNPSAGGYVGIGTLNPTASLHVIGAVRAGHASGTQWNSGNIGTYSIALGVDNLASGANSIALGQNSNASGAASTAIGSGAASATSSIAIGTGTNASGTGSMAMGTGTFAHSYEETAMGTYNTSYIPTSTSAWNASDRLFGIGNGTSSATSDAMVVLKKGYVGMGTSTPVAGLHVVGNTGILSTGSFNPGATPVSGPGIRMMWLPSYGSFRVGSVSADHWDSAYMGNYSIGLGQDVRASGTNSIVIGSSDWGSGDQSTTIGTQSYASGIGSQSLGNYDGASGAYSTAIGYSCYAFSLYETSVGAYNTLYTPSSTTAWVPTDRLFTIGNGTAPYATSDAMVVLKNGNIGIGTSTPISSLHVDNGNILATGTVGTGSAPAISGRGTRMMWIPYKSAFRAGTVRGAQWDTANIGMYSAAIGFNAQASGFGSIAIGQQINALSVQETVFGYYNTSYTPLSTNTFVEPTDRLFSIGNGTATILSDALVILKNGKVGIGTSTPNAPLHIGTANGNGITTGSVARSYFYGSSGTAITQNTSVSGNIMVQADGWYWANGGGYVATSDERIKNILGITDNQKDLVTLSQIKVTDYRYKDEIANGSGEHKKVIAQELNQVYPQAVKTNATLQIIPNIYQDAKVYSIAGNDITVCLTEEICDVKDIRVGANAKFYLYQKSDGSQKEMKGSIVSFDDKKIVIAAAEKLDASKYDERLFVYGTEINDLLSVDYEAISMLNVSATQELAKQLKDAQFQIALLKSENQEANSRNGKLQSDLDKLKASVETLQQMMGAKAER